jgi:hypothetical protein
MTAATLAALAGLLVASAASGYGLVLPDGARRHATDPAQGNAAAAARTSAQRQPSLQPTGATPGRPRVWTNADLARLRGSRLNVAPGRAEAPDDPLAVAVPEPDRDAEAADEAAWRAEAQRLTQLIGSIQQQLAGIEGEQERWPSLVLGTGDYQAAAAQALSRLQDQERAAEAALQQAEGQQALLEDRARIERVPPGWLR